MSIVTDFADIRSRMLGDDKPAPKILKVEKIVCMSCDNSGWFKLVMTGVSLPCAFCNPKGDRPCP